MDEIVVELESPNGPRVIAPRLASVDAILAALPEGWTVMEDDWQNGVDPTGDRQAFALSHLFVAWDESGCRVAIDTTSAEDAAEEYVGDGGFGDVFDSSRTAIHDVWVENVSTGDVTRHTVTRDPRSPSAALPTSTTGLRSTVAATAAAWSSRIGARTV